MDTKWMAGGVQGPCGSPRTISIFFEGDTDAGWGYKAGGVQGPWASPRTISFLFWGGYKADPKGLGPPLEPFQFFFEGGCGYQVGVQARP